MEISWVKLSTKVERKTMIVEHSSRFRALSATVLAVVVTGLLVAAPVRAQEPEGAPPAPTPTPAPTPVPASEIPNRVSEVAALLRSMETNAEPRPKVVEIEDGLAKAEEEIDALESMLTPLLEGDEPAYVLKDTAAAVKRVDRRMSGWLDTLAARTGELDNDLEDLKRRGERWELTRAEADAAELPDALVQQIDETLGAIKSTEQTIGERRAEVLTLQVLVAEQHGRLTTFSDQIVRKTESLQQHLLQIDSPPLWAAFEESKNSDLGRQMLETMGRNRQALRSFLGDHPRHLARDVVIFILILVLFVRLGRNARLWVQTDESLQTTAALLQRPVASSLLVSLIALGGLFHPTAPTAAQNLSGVVLLVIMLRLLPILVRRELRPAIGMLVGLVVLYLLIDLIPSTFLLGRIGELLLALLGAVACGWALHKERSAKIGEKDIWYWGGMWVAGGATVLFLVSALTNVIGAVAFATMLADATLGAIYDAITLWIFVIVFSSALTVALRTTTARRLLVVRYHSDRILSTVLRATRFVAVVVWIGYTLDHFRLFGSTAAAIKKFFFAQYTLGEFSLSVSNVAIFAVVIWVSIKLAQFTSFLLDTDVLPRLDLPKGVPATISKTTTYLIVALGSVIAVIAAGLDLSRATIIVGALGVGIGFGLQNAVNNFVSGLILLFGRPINVGDKIQIADVTGVVKDIGIRATVVRTWQGAEVIVPNATLISDNLINWTLSDDARRMEIPVGVAYGSPVDKVIEVLTDVARAHDEVLDDPEPVSLFQGFGDSSLNFELRAWTRGNFIAISSDLRVGIERVLAENHIEIPFPQRDLHVRSVGRRAATRLAGGDLEESIDADAPPSTEIDPNDGDVEENKG
jgi:small-conductance mechanosensitive channel